MSLPDHICLLPPAHLEKSQNVGIFPAVRYDTTTGFDLVSKKYRTAAGITDRISADNLILIVLLDIYIIDIGGLNINGAFFTHGHLDGDRCFTLKCGKNTVVNALMQQFEEKYDGVFTRRDTEVFLNNGAVQRYEEDSKILIDDALNAQLAKIKESCTRNQWNLKTCDLIFIGGTTNLLKDRIKKVFGDKVYIAKDAGFANADGYLKMFTNLLGNIRLSEESGGLPDW